MVRFNLAVESSFHIFFLKLLFQEKKLVLGRFACGAMRKGNRSTPQKLYRRI